MKEFDYELDYKQLDFTDAETRKLYRIGRGEQGVLLVRPYTDDICAHWRFVDEPTARKSADKIYSMFCEFRTEERLHWYGHGAEILEMGFTRARRYANHSSGRKYYQGTRKVRPQDKDWRTNTKAKSAAIFKEVRDSSHTILNTKK